jgi:hypothetical protein
MKVESVPVEAAVETMPWTFPVVMVTSTSDGVYVADKGLTRWEKIHPPSNG